MNRPLIEHTETIISQETGEIIEHKQYTKQQVKNSFEPDFVKLYINDVITLSSGEIKTTRVDVLYLLLSYLDYHNEIALTSDRREEVCESCNITMPYFKKVLKDFLDQQILFNKHNKKGEKIRSIYIANPHYFGRGKWEDIYNLRMTISYDKTRKRFVQVERNPEQQISLDIVAPTVCEGVELINS